MGFLEGLAQIRPTLGLAHSLVQLIGEGVSKLINRGGNETGAAKFSDALQSAQQAESSSPGAAMVASLDRDGDGAVSFSEFNGSEDMFEEMDRNDDGVLTVSELNAALSNTRASASYRNDGPAIAEKLSVNA